mmetsp:Transcript_44880/g.73549  ORF Transcript_44880/g.73549 Transcript_44880/m.73549 type:complete len:294 (-) Transcript_44880:725-1606(-)
MRSCLRTERGCPKPWVSMNEYLSVAVFFEYLHNNNGFVTWTIYLGEINLDYWGDPDHYGQSFPPLGQMIGASMANLLMEPALVPFTCAADVAGSTHCRGNLWAQGTLPPPAPRMLWASPACTLVGTSFCHRLHPRGAAWQPPLAAPGPAGQQGDFGRLRQGYGPGRHPPADDDQEPSPLRTDDRIASCSPDSPATCSWCCRWLLSPRTPPPLSSSVDRPTVARTLLQPRPGCLPLLLLLVLQLEWTGAWRWMIDTVTTEQCPHLKTSTLFSAFGNWTVSVGGSNESIFSWWRK